MIKNSNNLPPSSSPSPPPPCSFISPLPRSSPVFHSPSCSRLWIRKGFRGERLWILSYIFHSSISAASFTLNLLPRAKNQHGIRETCTRHRKPDYSRSDSLPILFSLSPPRTTWESRDVLTPRTGVLLLLSLLAPVSLPPSFLIPYLLSNPLFLPLLTYLDLSYHSFSLHFSFFNSVYISLPRAQR